MSTDPARDQETMQEDWLAILRRPGMNVLATFLTAQLKHASKSLEDPMAASSYEKVCAFRGEQAGFRKVMQFVKKEYDRAAKSDTPEKEK